MQVINTQSMAFGRFIAGGGGTVTLAPNGSRSAGGGVSLLNGGIVAPARFNVTGDPAATFALTLPADGEVVLTNNSGQQMPLTMFRSDPISPATLNGLGNQTISVGATLNVGPNQAPGAYSGSFPLYVEYD